MYHGVGLISVSICLAPHVTTVDLGLLNGCNSPIALTRMYGN